MAGPGSALPTPSRACPRPQPTVQPGAGPRGPHACLKGILAVLHSPGGRGGAAGGGGGTGWCQAPSSGCGGSAGPSGWAVPGPTRTRGKGILSPVGTPARGDPVRGTVPPETLQRLHTSPHRESESVALVLAHGAALGSWDNEFLVSQGPRSGRGTGGTPPHPGRGGSQCRQSAGPEESPGPRREPGAACWSRAVALGRGGEVVGQGGSGEQGLSMVPKVENPLPALPPTPGLALGPA